MKNVLFTTTALVALAGAAAAEVGFSGAVTAGYNDEIEGGLFWEADLDLTGSVDLGDNVTAEVTVQMGDWFNDGGTDHNAITAEIAYTGDTLSASLKFGDLGDKGASEYFYSDRSGMELDVENHDGTEDVRALLEFGNFGVAVGCGEVGNGTCDDGMNIGAGATFGSIELGIGYDEDAGGQTQVTAVSADTEFGAISVGVSYATSSTDPEGSIGVEVGFDVSDALGLGVYYAANDVGDDAYGASVDYTAGALTAGVYFDHTPGGVDEFGVDVSYAVNDMLTANAGYFDDGAGVFYVGMDYAVNDSITATVSYADADEISGPEYKDGITALITASF